MKIFRVVAVLLFALSIPAVGEEIDGCGWVQEICNNRCRPALVSCQEMLPADLGEELCWGQYDWCMNDCGSDFWCAYRSI